MSKSKSKHKIKSILKENNFLRKLKKLHFDAYFRLQQRQIGNNYLLDSANDTVFYSILKKGQHFSFTKQRRSEGVASEAFALGAIARGAQKCVGRPFFARTA